MLSYRGVRKRYGDVVALDGVTASFEPGVIHAILGPNGSGKSTLMSMAVGVVRPDEGEVRVDGVDPSRDPVAARRLVGYVPEENVLYESLTPAELISFVGSVYEIGSDDLEERTRTLVALLKLEGEMGKLCGELSHGNRRKVSIALALLHDPEVILMDEPFSGLDPEVGRVLREIMRKAAAEGKTVVFSTHVLELAEAVADEITIVHAGRVVARGAPDELKGMRDAEDLESVFLEVTGLAGEVRDLLSMLWGEGVG